MSLRVKEVFRTFQGEGSRAGSPAVFVRLSGCNLWSGREADRSLGQGQCAQWCDTEFFGGPKVELSKLRAQIKAAAGEWENPLIVLSGGEPMLQLRKPEGIEFLRSLKFEGRTIAIETNGTVAVPIEVRRLLDHVTVSPKPLVADPESMTHIEQRTGDDLKVVWPSPFLLDELAEFGRGFTHCFFQPMDPIVANAKRSRHALDPAIHSDPIDNIQPALEVAARLGWRLSLQTHKFAGVP